jgi:1,6-anhydro-N-acetylmuramate kinase
MSPVAYVNTLLLRHPHQFRACFNIEELATISFTSPHKDENIQLTVSRECGPGNILIDYAMQCCTSNDLDEDHEGRYATDGRVNQKMVDHFLTCRDYMQTPPSLIIS